MKRSTSSSTIIAEFDHLLPHIRTYLNQFPVNENALQKAMRIQARKDQKEHWLIPAEVGKFFYLLTRISGAKKIYEIGSYLGYSATWFAGALPEDGQVIVTEHNDERHQLALQFLQDSAYSEKIEIRKVDAHENLSQENEMFDIILIDHDKPFYQKAYEIAKKKLNTNGIILTDNVLWRGRIVKDEWLDDDSTAGVLAFNEFMMEDLEFTSLIVPIGDGVSISIRR